MYPVLTVAGVVVLLAAASLSRAPVPIAPL